MNTLRAATSSGSAAHRVMRPHLLISGRSVFLQTRRRPSWCRSKAGLTVAYSSSAAGKHQAFIAFGSNVGDRVRMIETALQQLDFKNINVLRTSSLWDTSPMHVKDQPRFLNGVCEVATDLGPFDLLDQLQSAEQNMGRQKIIDKGPRNIDLDVLLHDNQVVNYPELVIPHPLMLEREFVLRPLCELIPHWRMPNDPSKTFADHLRTVCSHDPYANPMSAVSSLNRHHAPLHTTADDRKTRIMSIINVTPDSFSDGGVYYNRDLHALDPRLGQLKLAKASIVDVGGQSTRPGADEVSEEEEVNRVMASIAELKKYHLCISVDTYRSKVARAAIEAGADMINDVSGGTMDPQMLSTAAKLGCTICLSHMRGTPKTMSKKTNYPDGVVAGVGRELLERVTAAEAAGIRRWRIILDPGLGFSKTVEQNVELLQRLPELRSFPGLQNMPWLVGPSRKGFIGAVTGVVEPRKRIWGTAAAVAAAVAGGADIVRVHDVDEMSNVVEMADAIWRPGAYRQ